MKAADRLRAKYERNADAALGCVEEEIAELEILFERTDRRSWDWLEGVSYHADILAGFAESAKASLDVLREIDEASGVV